MQRVETDNLLKTLYNFTEDEGNLLTVTKVFTYLLHRVIKPIEIEPILAVIYLLTFTQIMKFSYNEDEAIAIMHQFILSNKQLRTMKHIIEPKGMHFANINELKGCVHYIFATLFCVSKREHL